MFYLIEYVKRAGPVLRHLLVELGLVEGHFSMSNNTIVCVCVRAWVCARACACACVCVCIIVALLQKEEKHDTAGADGMSVSLLLLSVLFIITFSNCYFLFVFKS